MNEANIVRGYLEAALFCATDDDGEPLDRSGFRTTQYDADAVARATEDVRRFLSIPGVGDIVARYDDDDIGRDLYLTANRHGAGFWDGDYEDAEGDGEALTKAAHKLPGRHVYGEADAEGDRTLSLF